MDEDEKKEDDELKGEVLLPEVEEELPEDEEDDLDPLLHKHKKAPGEGEADEESLDALADEELEEDEPYDDVDNW